MSTPMAWLGPGAVVLEPEAVLRGEDPGPFEIVAAAGPASVHVRPLGTGCGDEFVVRLEALVPADPRIEEELRRLATASLALRLPGTEEARRGEQRRIRMAVQELAASARARIDPI